MPMSHSSLVLLIILLGLFPLIEAVVPWIWDFGTRAIITRRCRRWLEQQGYHSNTLNTYLRPELAAIIPPPEQVWHHLRAVNAQSGADTIEGYLWAHPKASPVAASACSAHR